VNGRRPIRRQATPFSASRPADPGAPAPETTVAWPPRRLTLAEARDILTGLHAVEGAASDASYRAWRSRGPDRGQHIVEAMQEVVRLQGLITQLSAASAAASG
jgi:hypothetical protein